MRRVATKAIFGSTLMENEVSRVLYEDFLPDALAEGRYLPASAPQIVGHGLQSIQAGLDTQKKGGVGSESSRLIVNRLASQTHPQQLSRR